MNGFIHTVGQQEFGSGDGEKIRDFGFHGLALGIFGELFQIEAPEAIQNAGRASDRVLVEVQAQALASRERRVICGKGVHCFSCSKHGCTSREWNWHAPVSLPRRPDIRWSEQSFSAPLPRVAAR